METVYRNTAQGNAEWLCDWQALFFFNVGFFSVTLTTWFQNVFFQSWETIFGKEFWGARTYSSSHTLIRVKVNISSGNRRDSQMLILYFCGWGHVWYSRHAWKIRSVMITHYTVSENFTHCLANQDAWSELKLVVLYTNVWKGWAASMSNLSGLWGAIFYVQWAWVGRWVGDDVQTGGGGLPEDHNHQLTMCHLSCSLHVRVLLHRGFKGVFTPPKEVYSVFASFYAYTHIDAEIISPVFLVSSLPLSVHFFSWETPPPAYVINPLVQSVYGSTQTTCNV